MSACSPEVFQESTDVRGPLLKVSGELEEDIVKGDGEPISLAMPVKPTIIGAESCAWARTPQSLAAQIA